MAKKLPALPKVPPRRGPYLCAAMLAEKVLEDKDSVPSAIRIVDRVQVPRNVELPPMGTALPLRVLLVVMFRAGNSPGIYPRRFIQAGPSGERTQLAVSQLTFDGKESTGTLSKAPLVIKWDGFGRYWLDLFVKDRFCTTIPLDIQAVPSGQDAS
jgi:hypothetical protein